MPATAMRSVPRPLGRPALSRLRRLTRAHVALARRPELAELGATLCAAVAGTLRAVLGTEVGLQGRVLLAATRASQGFTPGSGWAVLELSTAGIPVVVECELGLVLAAVAQLSGGRPPESPVDRLTRIEVAAAGHLVLSALSAVRHVELAERLWAPRFLGWEGRAEAARRLAEDSLVVLGVHARVGAHTGAVRLFVPGSAFALTLEELPVPRGPLSAGVGAAVLGCRLVAGRARLPGGPSLALGDGVLLPGLQLADGALSGSAVLEAPAFALTGLLGRDGFLRSDPPSQETPVSVPDDVASVDVEVELTRIRVPLAQLFELRVGAILPLHVEVSAPVLLRIGDRPVARAELVDVEGEVAARVLSLVE